jgi:hypothetical protein
MESWGSSVGIAIGYGLGLRGFDFRQKKYLSLLCSIQTGSGTHPASYLMGTEGTLLGSKAAES